ncbi:MAG: polyphosphate kinase 1 [Planctomycetaceae bacterium]|nr:polyphosphate kinase 1 [Planctomycetaceae bacterium]
MHIDNQHFINRELSWLEFNQRVLDEGRSPQVPLLERVKFLAISASNLDEFFQVRVGGLQMLLQEGSHPKDHAGMTPHEQLVAIVARCEQMLSDQYQLLLQDLEPALSQREVTRRNFESLEPEQHNYLENLFRNEIFAIATPMGISSETIYPLLPESTIHLAVRIQSDDSESLERWAIIPLSRPIPRFIVLPSQQGYEYILSEDVAQHFVSEFFPNQQVIECVPFRIMRNADLSVREDLAHDLLSQMEEIIDARKESACARLEIDHQATETMVAILADFFDVSDTCIFRIQGPLALTDWMQLAQIQGFDDLKDDPWPPQDNPQIDLSESIFPQIAKQDILLYHPFDSYEPVVRFIEEAADDPDVLSIKQTLYRTSSNSSIIHALARAARNGKYVTALLELKARFDEARNIEWARSLEKSGVQVIYGVKGLKTHSKVCIVTRREPQGIRRYMHFGTGNYNESTARLYTDISYLTTDPVLGQDTSSLFNAISGFSMLDSFQKLAASPVNLRQFFIEAIDNEIQQQANGKQGHIRAKMNSLLDKKIIEALYVASQKGVTIELNVRGICCLRPGIPGISDNIRVISIVDRYLEHARIYEFANGGDPVITISSADWMCRNLDRRVELLVPVEHPAAKARLSRVLDICMSDNVKGRELIADGSYQKPADSGSPVRAQATLFAESVEQVRQVEQSRTAHFEPYRAAENSH